MLYNYNNFFGVVMDNTLEKKQQIIFNYYIKWLEISGEPMTINDLSKLTGITRQTLSSLLSKNNFKMPRYKTLIALAKVFGNDFLTELGINNSEINEKTIGNIWNKLPEIVQIEIKSLIKPYSNF